MVQFTVYLANTISVFVKAFDHRNASEFQTIKVFVGGSWLLTAEMRAVSRLSADQKLIAEDISGEFVVSAVYFIPAGPRAFPWGTPFMDPLMYLLI